MKIFIALLAIVAIANAACAYNQYADPGAASACKNCDVVGGGSIIAQVGCNTCTVSGDTATGKTCVTCMPGYALTSASATLAAACTTITCSTGCRTCTASNACTACYTGWYLSSGACVACDNSAGKCTCCTSATACTSCTSSWSNLSILSVLAILSIIALLL